MEYINKGLWENEDIMRKSDIYLIGFSKKLFKKNNDLEFVQIYETPSFRFSKPKKYKTCLMKMDTQKNLKVPKTKY